MLKMSKPIQSDGLMCLIKGVPSSDSSFILEIRINAPMNSNSVMVDATLDYTPSTLVDNNRRSTIVSFNDGTANNRIVVLTETKSATATRTANLVIVTGGIVESNANITLGNLNVVENNNRLAAYFQSGTLATAASGTGTTTATAGNLSLAINAISIGSGPGSNYINGTIAKIQVWPALVTGSQLSTLTQ
jgi:hypothetical protein